MSIIENIKAIRTRLTKATSSVVGDVQSLRDRIREKRVELQRLRTSPAPMADIEAYVRDHVARTADSWLAREGATTISHLGGISKRGGAPWVGRDGSLLWDVQCVADPEAAVSLILKLASRIQYSAGPALADRPALSARLEADLADLEEGEEALVDSAAEAGLVIAHRPEVVARRQAAARKAQLDAERVANRSARQAAIDAGHAARPRVGQSQYLRANS